MFAFLMATYTVITVVFTIATFTAGTNGIQEDYDEMPPYLLPFSTIVQRTTRNMKDIGSDEHPPMTLYTMDFDHFSKLLLLLKAVNKITPAKPTEIHVPMHHRYQVKRSNMDFENYPNLPFSTLVRRGKDLD
jgi:hypothetical protein